MANDAALRSALVWLAAVVCVVGLCTLSFKKMAATYVVGVVGIAGVLCPDWAYFDRDFSRWTHPVTAEERASHIAQRSGPRVRIYPMRVIAYSIIYGFGLYKWWMFVSS
ncbi:Microsomal signal peptidase 12kDa subunit [Parasponia andersonii]|uniref:Microsomal signal peptidase 12kDa subunit n=1 Tax=Parasponia andersonii TaxID=3476 RepID=A0A2P5CKJ5_PARAD|nr:Microsomal signal peptidase 12kDa subunit [Parasponia andersonii]